jgi:hypothetical protein
MATEPAQSTAHPIYNSVDISRAGRDETCSYDLATLPNGAPHVALSLFGVRITMTGRYLADATATLEALLAELERRALERDLKEGNHD